MAQILQYPPDLLGDLTPLMEKVPYKPSLLTDLGIFKSIPTSSINLNIDVTSHGLSVIPEGQWGAPGQAQKDPKSEMLSLMLVELRLADSMSPEDLQDKRRPGSTGPSTVSQKMAEKMAMMKNNFELTTEFMQMTALKGNLLGGSGGSIYNYYTKFGVSQEARNMTFSDVAFDVAGAVRGLKDYILKNHKAPGILSGYTVLCSSSFFDKMMVHPTIKDAYKYYPSRQEPLRADVSASFEYMGVRFITYNASVTLNDGTSVAFVEDDKAYAFPTGLDLFQTYYGPEYSMEGCNKMGTPFYLRTKPMDFSRGIAMEGSSVLLPVNKRPEAVVQLTAN